MLLIWNSRVALAAALGWLSSSVCARAEYHEMTLDEAIAAPYAGKSTVVAIVVSFCLALIVIAS